MKDPRMCNWYVDSSDIPSTRAMMKSARHNGQFMNLKKARELDTYGFAKGYELQTSSDPSVSTIQHQNNVTAEEAAKQYEGMLGELDDEYAPYKETITNTGPTTFMSESSLLHNVNNGIRRMPPNVKVSEFYGVPFSMYDGVKNFGKFPTFDMNKWDESGTEDRIYDVMESGWDLKPKLYKYNKQQFFMPGGLENILAGFGIVWGGSGNRYYNMGRDNPFLNKELLGRIRKDGERTGINSEKEERAHQYFIMNQFNNALNSSNPYERKVAQFIQKFTPGVVGRTFAYAPNGMHFFSPGEGLLYIESPDGSLRSVLGSGSGSWEEFIHAIDQLAGNSDQFAALSDNGSSSGKAGIWNALNMDRIDKGILPISTGNKIGEQVASGKLQVRNIHNIADLLIAQHILSHTDDEGKISELANDRGYDRSWFHTVPAHHPSYYMGLVNKHGPGGHYRNLNAEIFNNIVNPYITGNSYQQALIENWFPKTRKWAFDRIAEAMDKYKDEDIGTTVALRKSNNPNIEVIY